MIFNMTGGGGNPLNFKVVGGTTKPSNPKENTIWVNTDKEITEWHFTSKQPDDMKEGEVWFSTGKYSVVEFNALKKTNVTVYPQSSKQMVSGTLKAVVAKTYQDGKWVEWWNGELYTPGNEWESVTGGWVTKGFRPDGSYTDVIMDKTAGSNTLVFTYNFSKKQGSSVQPDFLIDVTDFDTLTLDISITTTAKCTAIVRIEDEKGNHLASATLINGNTSYTKSENYDLSGVSGKCRIYIPVWSWSEASTITVTIRNAKLS